MLCLKDRPNQVVRHTIRYCSSTRMMGSHLVVRFVEVGVRDLEDDKADNFLRLVASHIAQVVPIATDINGRFLRSSLEVRCVADARM
jgi:hypothetical protein